TTSDDLAVMKQGRIIFRGSPVDLLRAAEGETWQLTLPPGRQPDPAWCVATSVRDARGLNLRIIGPRPSEDAQPALPTLEEAYLALMQSNRGLPSVEQDSSPAFVR